MFNELNSSQNLLLSAVIIWGVYTIVRGIPSIIMAISLYKEAKKHNKNKGAWALLGFSFPIIAPIGIFVYIKYTEKKLPSFERKGFSKQVIVSTVISVVIILTSFAIALSSFVVGALSFYKSATTDEHLMTCYDIMGNEYDEFSERIDMYSKDGKKYKFEYDKGFDAYYIAEDGTKLDADKCFIDSDGWFFYDQNSELVLEGTEEFYLFGSNFERYKDKDGKKYYILSDFAYFFDEKGDLYCQKGKRFEKVDFNCNLTN